MRDDREKLANRLCSWVDQRVGTPQLTPAHNQLVTQIIEQEYRDHATSKLAQFRDPALVDFVPTPVVPDGMVRSRNR